MQKVDENRKNSRWNWHDNIKSFLSTIYDNNLPTKFCPIEFLTSNDPFRWLSPSATVLLSANMYR